jgi:hypothetical protein
LLYSPNGLDGCDSIVVRITIEANDTMTNIFMDEDAVGVRFYSIGYIMQGGDKSYEGDTYRVEADVHLVYTFTYFNNLVLKG